LSKHEHLTESREISLTVAVCFGDGPCHYVV